MSAGRERGWRRCRMTRAGGQVWKEMDDGKEFVYTERKMQVVLRGRGGGFWLKQDSAWYSSRLLALSSVPPRRW